MVEVLSARPRTLLTRKAVILARIRVEGEMEDVGMVGEMHMAEDIMGTIDPFGLTFRCSEPKFKLNGQIHFHLWQQQVMQYLALIDAPCMKLLEGFVAQFYQMNFGEVWPMTHYTYDVFKISAYDVRRGRSHASDVATTQENETTKYGNRFRLHCPSPIP